MRRGRFIAAAPTNGGDIVKIVARIIRYILIAAVFAAIGFLLFRIWVFNHYWELEDVTPTAAAIAEYEKGDAANVLTNPVHDKLSSSGGVGDGNFAGSSFVYFPDEKEIQVTIRMNDSIFEKLGIDGMPEFFLKIFTNYDYDSEENDVETRQCVRYEDDHFWMYSYRRLVFEDVEIGENNDVLVCIAGEEGDSELVIHFREQELEKYDFSRADKKAIEAAMQ